MKLYSRLCLLCRSSVWHRIFNTEILTTANSYTMGVIFDNDVDLCRIKMNHQLSKRDFIEVDSYHLIVYNADHWTLATFLHFPLRSCRWYCGHGFDVTCMKNMPCSTELPCLAVIFALVILLSIFASAIIIINLLFIMFVFYCLSAKPRVVSSYETGVLITAFDESFVSSAQWMFDKQQQKIITRVFISITNATIIVLPKNKHLQLKAWQSVWNKESEWSELIAADTHTATTYIIQLSQLIQRESGECETTQNHCPQFLSFTFAFIISLHWSIWVYFLVVSRLKQTFLDSVILCFAVFTHFSFYCFCSLIN